MVGNLRSIKWASSFSSAYMQVVKKNKRKKKKWKIQKWNEVIDTLSLAEFAVMILKFFAKCPCSSSTWRELKHCMYFKTSVAFKELIRFLDLMKLSSLSISTTKGQFFVSIRSLLLCYCTQPKITTSITNGLVK